MSNKFKVIYIGEDGDDNFVLANLVVFLGSYISVLNEEWEDSQQVTISLNRVMEIRSI